MQRIDVAMHTFDISIHCTQTVIIDTVGN